MFVKHILATVGVALDLGAAAVVTIPVAFEPHRDVERRVEAMAKGEASASVWWSPEQDKHLDSSTRYYRLLFGADRLRARLSLGLVVAGVGCNVIAMWT